MDGMDSDENGFFTRQGLLDRVSYTVNILSETQMVSFQLKRDIGKEDIDVVGEYSSGF